MTRGRWRPHPHGCVCPRCRTPLTADGACPRASCAWVATPYEARLLAAGFQVLEGEPVYVLDDHRGTRPPGARD